MLERVLIILHVVVVVVRIGEEAVARGEDVGRGEVGLGELEGCGLLDFVDFAGIVGEVAAELVAQVGVDVSVAYDLGGGGDAVMSMS